MSSELGVRTIPVSRNSQLSFAALPVSAIIDEEPTVTVPISSLLPSDSPRIDGENAEYVRILSEIEGDAPPIIVHRRTMRVIDGMHRLHAATARGRHTIEVRFFDGPERDVFPLAVELNSRNGLPLSHSDRTAAAVRVIRSHPHWSDRVIAELIGLSNKTVAGIRSRSTEEGSQLNERIGRDGKVRPLNTMRGRRLAGRLMSMRPGASLREIAREAGISLGTAQDVRRRLQLGEDPVPPKQRRAEGEIEPARGDSPADPAGEQAPPSWDSEAVTKLLPRLKNDPSLRLSEIGRTVLRLLDANSIPGRAWMKLVDAVPVHCTDAVAGMARTCARSWLRFADEVEKRGVKLG